MLLLTAHPHFTSLLDSIFKCGNWHYNLSITLGLPWCFRGKESACQYRRCGFEPWARKNPWRREWQPTLGFLPREPHEQRSLAGYSPWDCKELDTTERLSRAQHHVADSSTCLFSENDSRRFILHFSDLGITESTAS